MRTQKSPLGFTLPEMMVTVAILGILAAIAIPSFTGMLERRRLVSTAETITSDLRWARSEAFKRNANVTITFTPGDAGTWSYTIAPGDKTVDSAAIAEYDGIALAENFSSDDTVFDHVRGTATTDGCDADCKVTLTSENGDTLSIKLGFLGRTYICGTIGGYDAC
ncbi:MAG: GspH/FimT family pseudopilin [Methylovulum sp.]|nr:GspH/FimT family pseudopilin [Methylovulum sp.]